jgi:ABC-2 type transport system permease protein
VRTWFNPNLKANVDMIPGLIALVLGVPGMSVALTMAREHEHGTMEQLMATPIGRADLLVGKIGPYLISGVFNIFLVTGLAMWWFQVPFRGSFLLFLALSVIYFFSLLSMSMIVGVFLRTQAGALAASFLVVFFPGFFLTGVFFPIAAMPSIVRLEAMVLPGTHYAIITRGIFTTGIGFSVLWPNAVAMMVLGVVFIGVAALFFRKKLA